MGTVQITPEIYLDTKQSLLLVNNTPFPLFPIECKILEYLYNNRNRTVTHEMLQNKFWSGLSEANSRRRCKTYISNLRKILKDNNKEIIQTWAKNGYKLIISPDIDKPSSILKRFFHIN